MKVVNFGDPYTRRLTLRLTEMQYKYLLKMSDELETSPSDYIRYLILQSALVYDKDFMIMGGTSDENVEASSHNNI